MVQREFGGSWTQDKLSRLQAYLTEYMKIFRKRPDLIPHYVDAFAGTGQIPYNYGSTSGQLTLLDEDDEGFDRFVHGSARIALEIDPPFQHYLFIERDAAKVAELNDLKLQFPELAERIQIENAEANDYLIEYG